MTYQFIDERDPLSEARGVVIAALIAIPVWVAIGAVVWAVSR